MNLFILAAMCIHLDSSSIAYRKIIKRFEKENICTSALYGNLSIFERLSLIMAQKLIEWRGDDHSAFKTYLDL